MADVSGLRDRTHAAPDEERALVFDLHVDSSFPLRSNRTTPASTSVLDAGTTSKLSSPFFHRSAWVGSAFHPRCDRSTAAISSGFATTARSTSAV